VKQVYTIDGNNFENLKGFYEEFSNKVLDGCKWGKNLDAFDDVLCGDFGTPHGGFVLKWINSKISREKLGYDETVRVLEHRLTVCHPLNVDHVRSDIAVAQSGSGQTIFDVLIEIIGRHGGGGELADDGVELELL
jgi:RNAse (barnase) inhibitor barstar